MCFNQIALFIYDFKAVYLAVSIILSNLKHVSIWSTWVFFIAMAQVMFSQMKSKSAIFMIKETSNKWCDIAIAL